MSERPLQNIALWMITQRLTERGRMGPMPKFVDYAGRYAFFEEAAFTIVRDEGVHRLSRHRVAAVLGTSISTIRRVVGPQADLRSLALREVEQRRLVGRRGPLTGEPLDVAVQALRRVLPDSDGRVAEELVWWRLVFAAPVTTRALDLDALVRSVLDSLGCSEGTEADEERARTVAVLDGLGIAVCLGRSTPEEACEVLRRHLAEIAAQRKPTPPRMLDPISR